MNLGGAFDTLKYRRDFRREHPFYFNPCGTLIFSGPQGSGKTLSAVDYVTRIMEEYPHAILCTNTEFADYPFNAVVAPEPNGEMSVRDYFSHELITHEWICDRLAENSSYRVCVEYSGLDCLKWVNNGEYGVIFFIDEFEMLSDSERLYILIVQYGLARDAEYENKIKRLQGLICRRDVDLKDLLQYIILISERRAFMSCYADILAFVRPCDF